jgi:hypothetical protein
MSAVRGANISAEGRKYSFASIPTFAGKGELVMTNFALLVATAISLLAAAPAIAMPHHHRYAYSRSYTSSNYSGDFDRRNTFN